MRVALSAGNQIQPVCGSGIGLHSWSMLLHLLTSIQPGNQRPVAQAGPGGATSGCLHSILLLLRSLLLLCCADQCDLSVQARLWGP